MDSRLAHKYDARGLNPTLLQREALDQIIEGLMRLRDALEPGVEVERVPSGETVRPYAFERARDGLIQAQERYKTAVNALLTARSQLETKRAKLLVEGVEGKNAESRDAAVRVQLQEDYEGVEQREAALNEARSDLEIARLEWDTLRYQLRLMGVPSAYETPY